MLSANYCRHLNMVSLHKKYAKDLDMSANMTTFAMTSKENHACHGQSKWDDSVRRPRCSE